MAAPSNPTTFPSLFNFAVPEQSGATFTPMTYSQWGEPVEHDGMVTYNEPFVPGTRELMYLIQTKQYDTALFQAADNKPDGMPGALMRQAVYLNRQQGVIETVVQDYERHIEQMTKVVESYRKWKAANSSHLVNVVTRLAPQQLVMQGPVTVPHSSSQRPLPPALTIPWLAAVSFSDSIRFPGRRSVPENPDDADPNTF
ncbi:hypothetical protein MPER_13173 [Moniliophthora perniciosa FA553]|nr:hypothetical protein MPER_13173 [Moniliophthora perniciosa FA553]